MARQRARSRRGRSAGRGAAVVRQLERESVRGIVIDTETGPCASGRPLRSRAPGTRSSWRSTRCGALSFRSLRRRSSHASRHSVETLYLDSRGPAVVACVDERRSRAPSRPARRGIVFVAAAAAVSRIAGEPPVGRGIMFRRYDADACESARRTASGKLRAPHLVERPRAARFQVRASAAACQRRTGPARYRSRSLEQIPVRAAAPQRALASAAPPRDGHRFRGHR